MNLVMDLRITYERWGSTSNPLFNGRLHYPLPDIDKPLNDDTVEKIREYHADYSNRPSNSTSFIPVVPTTFDRLHCELERILFLQDHRKLTGVCVVGLQIQELNEKKTFFAVSGVE